VILQQTRVDQAIPRYERFVRRFPDVLALARATETEVLKAWEGAGYYARARHLHAAARLLTADGKIRWPSDREGWQRLPGVGPYIARALASEVLGDAVVALDSNGRRVAARWTLERGDVSRPAVARRLEDHLRRALPEGRAGAFNEAVMELGERICRPRRPDCPTCPVASMCRARRELDDPGSIPVAIRRPRRPHVRAAIAAIVRGRRWLVHRRPSTGLLGGLWELPGGKLERGELPEAAVRREVREETGLELADLVRAGRVHHGYSHFSVELDVFRGRAIGRLRTPGDPDAFRWVTPAEFERLPRPRATVRAARLIRSEGPGAASRD
jgi:A/G-specific adenine glycosylase